MAAEAASAAPTTPDEKKDEQRRGQTSSLEEGEKAKQQPKGVSAEERRRKDAEEEKSIPEPVSNATKDWFKGLTAEERAVAASFTDEAFLGSFLAFAAPWSGHHQLPYEGGEYQVYVIST